MPYPEPFLAAAISMNSTQDVSANVAKAEAWVREAASRGARWIQLPEMFPYIGPYEHSRRAAEMPGGPIAQQFASLAKELGVILFAGSMNELPEGQNAAEEAKVYNTSYVFGSDGTTLAKYRKIHLFNLLDTDGSPLHCEAEGFLAGEIPTSFEHGGLHIAMSICYDLRFGELYRKLGAARPIDVITVPSAFTKATGEAHWHLLLRARAVEFQSWVIAANQVGVHRDGKESFGHSLIVDPWGEVVADSGTGEGIALAAIDPARVATVRGRLPVFENRQSCIFCP